MATRKLALRRVEGPRCRRQACRVTEAAVALFPTFSSRALIPAGLINNPSTLEIPPPIPYFLKCVLLRKESQKSFVRLCHPSFWSEK